MPTTSEQPHEAQLLDWNAAVLKKARRRSGAQIIRPRAVASIAVPKRRLTQGSVRNHRLLPEHFDVPQCHFKRKALPGGSQRNDDLALLTQFRHHAFDTFEYSIADPYPLAHRDVRMWTQQQPACKSLPNSLQLSGADKAPLVVSKGANDTGDADDIDSRSRRKPGEYISRKKRAFGHGDPVRPLDPLPVKGQVVLDRTNIEMLRHSFFVVGTYVKNLPMRLSHRIRRVVADNLGRNRAILKADFILIWHWGK